MQKSQKSTLSKGPWTLILQIQNQNAIKTFSCLIMPAQDTFRKLAKTRTKHYKRQYGNMTIWQGQTQKYKIHFDTKYI